MFLQDGVQYSILAKLVLDPVLLFLDLELLVLPSSRLLKPQELPISLV